MNLGSIDLNLLHLLSTVLEERSATRAARKLHVTQSAVSNALRRARDLFGDPLVVRRSHGVEPTPRGLALQPALREWVETTRRLLVETPTFDPSKSTRVFRIACVDAIAATLLQPILRLLKERAPSARLQLLTLDRFIAEDGLVRGEVDLLIGMPPVLADEHDAETVYLDPMECFVRADHPKVREKLTLDAYAKLPHVELALFNTIHTEVDQALAKQGRTRTVQVALPYFSSIPLAVLETDCIATLSSRLVRSFAERWPLRVFQPPIPLDAIEVRQVWHRRADVDGAVRFLRDVVRDAARLSAPSRRKSQPRQGPRLRRST
ncbi:LysR family transcriptional regulator [Myxococcus stipitatus DSM 14675]|uniref:LysR family transcriptional regulator n=1 Tax=Myxococcus stipitatus (strain DSM 14675 / JCM 12634 / Mx s8) TaxID=1278073 RepID=L7UCH0_MYXSD|nr:LysR family transcriptional regulator [Myxococcus stipitatus]AGC45560.1 LysR family transcriptional regulator [Myxococcus stipitatus DSM 14675]